MTLADITGGAVQQAFTDGQTNKASLLTKASNALVNNTNYLAIGAPTNPQVVAQVQSLTKQCNAVIRLLIGQLDDTSGT